MAQLPDRKPDYQCHIVSSWAVPVWQQSDHYVASLKMKDGNILSVSSLGQYPMLADEIKFAILKALLDKYGSH